MGEHKISSVHTADVLIRRGKLIGRLKPGKDDQNKNFRYGLKIANPITMWGKLGGKREWGIVLLPLNFSAAANPPGNVEGTPSFLLPLATFWDPFLFPRWRGKWGRKRQC